jgi:hypothetical protein
VRGPAPLLWLCLGGCGTVVPMQTASVVEPGGLRVGGQASAGYCDFGPPTFPCNIYSDGIPLPALRVDARRGVGRGSDLGGSLQLQGMIYAPERPVQLDVTLDGKRELLRRGIQLMSMGVLVGGGLAGRLGLAPWLQAQVGVPLFYGVQTARHEYVASIWTAYGCSSRQWAAPSTSAP